MVSSPMFADTTRLASSLLLFPSGLYLQSILHLTFSLLNLSFFPSTPSPSLLCASPLLSSLTIRASSPSPVPLHLSPPHALPIYSRIQSIFIDSVVPPPFHLSLSLLLSLSSSLLFPNPLSSFSPSLFLHFIILFSALLSPLLPHPLIPNLFSLFRQIWLPAPSICSSSHSPPPSIAPSWPLLPSPHATIIHLRSVGRYGAACIKKG